MAKAWNRVTVSSKRLTSGRGEGDSQEEWKEVDKNQLEDLENDDTIVGTNVCAHINIKTRTMN